MNYILSFYTYYRQLITVTKKSNVSCRTPRIYQLIFTNGYSTLRQLHYSMVVPSSLFPTEHILVTFEAPRSTIWLLRWPAFISFYHLWWLYQFHLFMVNWSSLFMSLNGCIWNYWPPNLNKYFVFSSSQIVLVEPCLPTRTVWGLIISFYISRQLKPSILLTSCIYQLRAFNT